MADFDLIQDFIVVLVTYKNEEDPIQYKGARVATILQVDVSDAQGQIIHGSLVGSGRNSKSVKHLCMPFLPARMKKIQQN